MRYKIFISGVSRGIGEGMARHFITIGHHVFGTFRTSTDELHHELTESSSFTPISMDVTSEQSVGAAMQQLSRTTASIDILINNAGVYPESGDEKFQDVSMADFESAVAVNYLGSVRVTHHLLPFLSKSTIRKIIFMGSGAGSITTNNDSRRFCYGPSKAALHQFYRTLSHELTPPEWLIALISPGWVQTDMGGSDADLTVDEVIPDLSQTILALSTNLHGAFLDRFGNTQSYQW